MCYVRIKCGKEKGDFRQITDYLLRINIVIVQFTLPQGSHQRVVRGDAAVLLKHQFSFDVVYKYALMSDLVPCPDK